MAGEGLQFLKPGDQLTAQQWNEVARLLKMDKGLADSTLDSNTQSTRRRFKHGFSDMTVTNSGRLVDDPDDPEYGSDDVGCTPGSAIAAVFPASLPELDGSELPSVSDFLERPIKLEGFTPVFKNAAPGKHSNIHNSLGNHFGKIAVYTEDAPLGGDGEACMSGVVAAIVNVDKGHEWYDFADAREGKHSLQSYPGGSAQIIWQPRDPNTTLPMTGAHWSLVRIGNVQRVIRPFKLLERMSPSKPARAAPLMWDGCQYTNSQASHFAWEEVLYDDAYRTTVALPGETLWAQWDYGNLRWEVISQRPSIIRVRLVSNLFECGSAQAVIINPNSCGTTDADDLGDTLNICDPMNSVLASLLAVDDGTGTFFIPMGTCAYVIPSEAKWAVTCDGSGSPMSSSGGAAAWYEPIAYGFCCAAGSAEGSVGESSEFGGSGGSAEGSLEGSAGSGSESAGSGSTCPYPVTGASTSFPNYNPSVKQVLGHDEHGCWVWIDIGKCNPSSGS